MQFSIKTRKRGRTTYKMCKTGRVSGLVLLLSMHVLVAVIVGDIDALTEAPYIHRSKNMVLLRQGPFQASFRLLKEKCLRAFLMV